jgi:hypothetical protein
MVNRLQERVNRCKNGDSSALHLWAPGLNAGEMHNYILHKDVYDE